MKAKFLLLAVCLLQTMAMSYGHAEVATTDGGQPLTLNLTPPRAERAAAPQVLFNEVDSTIVIAVDVSGSIDRQEYDIQKSGVVSAFLDENLQRTLTQCNSNGIAVTYVEWSGSRNSPQVQQVVPWTRLNTPRDMIGFANRIRAQPRSSSGDTDVAAALTVAGQLIQSSPFHSARNFVSLSSDGRQDYGAPGISTEENLRQARNRLGSTGAVVNSIVIEGSGVAPQGTLGPVSVNPAPSDLADYYRRNVSTGPGAAVTSVRDFSGYAEAIKRQLTSVLNACIS